jgi:hypothetical protein
MASSRASPDEPCSSGARRSSSSACPTPPTRRSPAMSPLSSDGTRRRRARRWPTTGERQANCRFRYAAVQRRRFSRRCARRTPAGHPRRLARRAAAPPAQRQSRCRRRARRGRLRARPPGARATHRWRLGAQLLPGPRRAGAAAARHLPAAARQRGRARNPLPGAHLQPAPGAAGALSPRVVGGRHELPAGRDRDALDDDEFVRLPPIATVVQAPAGSSQREVRVQLTPR